MNVLFYVMDCLRADHVSALGYGRRTTPNLDRLAAEGVAFSRCYAQSGWTAPSAATMFSGQIPSRTGIHKMRDALNPDMPWLPEMLQHNGFVTVGFSSMYQVSRLRGFHRGFTDFFDLFMDPQMMEVCRARDIDARGDHYCLPLSEDLHARALNWLDARKDSFDPWYMLIWSIDTHEPFRQPPRFNTDADPGYRGPINGRGRPFTDVANARDRQQLIDLYDGALRYQDEQLGKLVEALRERNQLDDTLIIVVGDHGEMFWEHGIAGHGKFPWEEELRVPLIMRCPQILPQGKVFDSLVQMIDVPATIADYAGLPPEPRFRGKSLRPVFEGAAEHLHDAIVLEVPFPHDPERKETARVVITKDRLKLVQYVAPGFPRRLRWMVKEYGRAFLSLFRPGTISLYYGHYFRRGPRVLLDGFFWSLFWPFWLVFGGTDTYVFDLSQDPREDYNRSSSHPRVKELLAVLAAADAGQVAGKSLAGSSAEEQEKKIEEHLRQLGYVED